MQMTAVVVDDALRVVAEVSVSFEQDLPQYHTTAGVIHHGHDRHVMID